MSDIIRASDADRVYLCPASFNAAKGLYKADTAQANSGTRVHNAIHTMLSGVGLVPDLDEREMYIARLFVDMVREYELSHGGANSFYHELTVNLRGEDHLPIFEGHIDRMTICRDGTFIVWDYKTGRKEAVASSHSVQQRVYVCAVSQLFATHKIKSIVLSAENLKDPMTVTVYDEASIKASMNDLYLVYSLAMQDNAKFNAGERQCEYCPAKGTPRCPSTMTALVEFRDQLPVDPKTIGALYALSKQVKKYCDNVEDQLRAMLESGVEGTGFKLGCPSKSKEVTNVASAFHALSDIISESRFLDSCKVNIGEKGIVGAIRDALIQKGEECTLDRAKKIFEERLLAAGCLEWKEKAPSIVEDTEAA